MSFLRLSSSPSALRHHGYEGLEAIMHHHTQPLSTIDNHLSHAKQHLFTSKWTRILLQLYVHLSSFLCITEHSIYNNFTITEELS